MNLSTREKEVLALVAMGKPDKEIAAMLCVSRRTVQTHMRRIFAKLQVSNRVAAAARYYSYYAKLA